MPRAGLGLGLPVDGVRNPNLQFELGLGIVLVCVDLGTAAFVLTPTLAQTLDHRLSLLLRGNFHVVVMGSIGLSQDLPPEGTVVSEDIS